MEIGDWITLGAVIVALGIGVASLIHTQILQKKEHREQQLNEIIDWAEKIIKSLYGQDISVINLEGEALYNAIIYGVLQLKIRSDYIKQIASGVDTNISYIINEVIDELNDCHQLHFEYISCKENDKEKKWKEAVKKQGSLFEKAKIAIEETSKIKVKQFN